jgi:acyl-CoA synthetase (NDP forming)
VLRSILAPRSLAVIGVSSRPDSLSAKLLENIVSYGYTGTVYPINPRAERIGALACYPSLAAVPERVETAILMVPAERVMTTVEECMAAGVEGLIVITAGFREASHEGAVLERALVERLRGSGVRMVGPNCMGVINTDPTVRLDATFTPAPAIPGSVAFASHSGALGVAVLEAAAEAGLGFSQFVSVGNSADVNVNDVLEHWEHHDATRAVMLYLESLDEPRRFLELASRITPHKPIIALKAGRTAAGQRAASSHTGALAAADTAVDAVLRQAGVLRAGTLSEMFDLALAAQSHAVPQGRRVAVITNAGGPAIVATDALVSHSLEVAELAEETRAALRAYLPPQAPVGNPVDMLPSARPEDYRRAVELALGDGGVDAAVVITVTPPQGSALEVARAVAAGVEGASKPVTTVFMTAAGFYPQAHRIPGMPPVYRYPEWAVRALAGMIRQAEAARCARRKGEAATPPLVASPTLEAALGTARGYLGPAETFAVLEEIGISVAPWRVAGDPEAVVAVARELGFPVVLKAFGAALVHKSELGAVALGLRDEGELGQALAAMRARLADASTAPEGFLVQRQVTGGREVILGLTRDPAVGVLVMCGLGGVAVEVWKDVAFRVAPLTAADARAMIGELKGAALLGAFRGRPPADTAALEDALVRLAALGATYPRLAECDVNPLLILDDGAGCLAVDARILLGD